MGGCTSKQSVNNSKAPATATHSVSVKTGDKKGASTDGNVFVCVRDKSGIWSADQLIDKQWKNDFQAGNTDVFYLELLNISRVTDLCIRRDETAKEDSWFLEKVVIEELKSKSSSVFPVTRWINAGDQLMFEEFDSCLPQYSKFSEQRAKELEKKREAYKLTNHVPGTPPQIQELPADEQFSDSYKWDIVANKAKLFIETKFIDLTTPKFEKLDDFNAVYKGNLPLPYGANMWRKDEEFGNQRLSGCNPVKLKLCQAIPKNFAVTAELVKEFLEGKTLEERMTEKKIYIVDLTYMATIKCTADRKLPGPLALFYSNTAGSLLPVAIQLMPEPAEDNPVFTPADPEYTWLSAKMWFNLADASLHQSVTHLGFTHLIMEAVAACTHRQLSPSHPMFRLLAPHFIYLLAINTLAVNKLVSPNGWVDETMQIGRTGMFNLIEKNWADWDLKKDGNLLEDLRRRGVDDVTALPNYHYRDDAILLWEALQNYVSRVVNGVYDEPEQLAADHELQAWAKQIAEAGFKGMPASFTSNEELVEVITVFIFIASVGHAAANFCQYDEYAFPPNYPATLLGERPKDKNPLTEEYIVDCLPTKKQTLSIMIVTKLLSDRGTNELTNFEMQYAYDPITLGALKQLKEDLKKISTTIASRNSKRVRKYTYLHPSEIPNAISI